MRQLAIMVMLILPGCTTTLWSPDYQEVRINGFYVNKERGELLVSARDNGYIFPIDKEFGDALLLGRTIPFSPRFEHFSIDEKHNVTGTLSLVLIGKLNDQDTAKLKELGFKEGGQLKDFRLSRMLKGKQYKIEGNLPMEKLKKEYSIMVAQPDSYADTAGKIIATPAAIAIDGVITVPAVFLMATVMALGGE